MTGDLPLLRCAAPPHAKGEPAPATVRPLKVTAMPTRLFIPLRLPTDQPGQWRAVDLTEGSPVTELIRQARALGVEVEIERAQA